MSNLYVYLMCSRNKDNKNVPDFKERTKTILEYEENEENVIKAFKSFSTKGVHGEQTRLYKSVNSRNENKIREDFIVRLLKDKPSVTKLNGILASVAQQACNRDESKWLFDFDVNDAKLVAHFIYDIYAWRNNHCNTKNEKLWALEDITYNKTPHGYAIVVPSGFDTRALMEKWKDYDITLKKDDLLFLDMIMNEKVK